MNSHRIVWLVVLVAAVFVMVRTGAAQRTEKVEVPPGVLEKLNEGASEYKGAELEAFEVDLNEDGKPEIAVIGRRGTTLCSGSGNCSFWLFESTPDGYAELMRHHHVRDGDVFDSLVSDWKVLASRTRGYRDLRFFYADTPIISTATQYRMSKGKYEYVPGSCATVTYGYFDEGKFHEYDPPKSKPCGD